MYRETDCGEAPNAPVGIGYGRGEVLLGPGRANVMEHKYAVLPDFGVGIGEQGGDAPTSLLADVAKCGEVNAALRRQSAM